MKVYLVFHEVQWEGSYFKDAFSTKEKAQDYVKQAGDPCIGGYVIEEVEVQ